MELNAILSNYVQSFAQQGNLLWNSIALTRNHIWEQKFVYWGIVPGWHHLCVEILMKTWLEHLVRRGTSTPAQFIQFIHVNYNCLNFYSCLLNQASNNRATVTWICLSISIYPEFPVAMHSQLPVIRQKAFEWTNTKNLKLLFCLLKEFLSLWNFASLSVCFLNMKIKIFKVCS